MNEFSCEIKKLLVLWPDPSFLYKKTCIWFCKFKDLFRFLKQFCNQLNEIHVLSSLLFISDSQNKDQTKFSLWLANIIISELIKRLINLETVRLWLLNYQAVILKDRSRESISAGNCQVFLLRFCVKGGYYYPLLPVKAIERQQTYL